MVRGGVNPKAEIERQRDHERSEARRKALEDNLGSVEDMFRAYVYRMKDQGKDSYREVWRCYVHDIQSTLGSEKAKNVGSEQIADLLAKPVERGSLVLANRLRSYLHAAFAFAMKYDLSPVYRKGELRFDVLLNPVSRIPREAQAESAGDRNLSKEELKNIWGLLPEGDLGVAMRLMVATGGQRVSEILKMKWSDISLEDARWEMPHSKTGRPHVVPLGSIALDLLRSLQEKSSDDDYVFPSPRTDSDQEKPMRIASPSRFVRRFCEDHKIEHFTPRDLRRTVKTLMGVAGIRKEDRDILQNHARSDVSSKHYDRYDYLREKRRTIAQWDRWLNALLKKQKDDVVVPLRAANQTAHAEQR